MESQQVQSPWTARAILSSNSSGRRRNSRRLCKNLRRPFLTSQCLAGTSEKAGYRSKEATRCQLKNTGSTFLRLLKVQETGISKDKWSRAGWFQHQSPRRFRPIPATKLWTLKLLIFKRTSISCTNLQEFASNQDTKDTSRLINKHCNTSNTRKIRTPRSLWSSGTRMLSWKRRRHSWRDTSRELLKREMNGPSQIRSTESAFSCRKEAWKPFISIHQVLMMPNSF